MTSYDNLQMGDQKCHGIYLGTVVQHLAHGKLKVYVHGLYPEEFQNQPEKLPTCIQVVPQFAGSHSGNGVFSYPNIGATVVCMFANGDQNLPIMIGSLLGGENAFGQYEIVKATDEISSTRHLITSGQSHVELYENGKISSIVVDPILTESKVTYDNSIDGQLSIDAVSQRPTWEQVDAKEISSINCQHVLDNHENKGTISSSTHWYSPGSGTSIISGDNGQTITTSIDGEEYNDSYLVQNNIGKQYFGQHYCKKAKELRTESNPAAASTVAIISPLTSDISVEYYHGIDGVNSIAIDSQSTGLFSKTTSTASGTEISTLNVFSGSNSTFKQEIPTQFSIVGKTNEQSNNAYSNSSTGDVKTKKIKFNASNSIKADAQMKIEIASLSASKLVETDSLIRLSPHQNVHDAHSIAAFDAENGFSFDGEYNDDDLQSIDGNVVQIKKNNIAKIDAQTSKDPSIAMHAKNKVQRSINGNTSKEDVDCFCYMLPSKKKLEISIVDNVQKSYCKITLGANGEAEIAASKSLKIDAPNIAIVGQSMTQQFKTISQKASTININGGNGDCKIKNVSLVNHVHMETQAGDIVRPQPTKSATQSN